MPLLIDNYWANRLKPLLLMLDYDGTLATIVSDPKKAFLTAEQMTALKQLTKTPLLRVVIVSGRSVEQLKNFLEPLLEDEILFCGLHGGEIYHPKTNTFLLSAHNPQILEGVSLFSKCLQGLLEKHELLNGEIVLENKGYSIAMHYRNAQDSNKAKSITLFNEAVLSDASIEKNFSVQKGKEVLELVPKSFSKGQCVEFLYQHFSPSESIQSCYIGDDLTDESAFQVVNTLKGLSICVGKHVSETHAIQTMASVNSVYDALKSLIKQ